MRISSRMKKLVSEVLTIAMVLSLIPAPALAEILDESGLTGAPAEETQQLDDTIVEQNGAEGVTTVPQGDSVTTVGDTVDEQAVEEGPAGAPIEEEPAAAPEDAGKTAGKPTSGRAAAADGSGQSGRYQPSKQYFSMYA